MIIRLITVAAGLSLLLTGAAAQQAPEPLAGRIVVIDGDTLWHYPEAGQPAEKIRVLNIDAPETRNAVCEAERVAGYRAKEVLATIINSARSLERPIMIARCETSSRCRDTYGRTLGRIMIDGRDIGETLLTDGIALPWKSGAAAKFERQMHWCGGK